MVELKVASMATSMVALTAWQSAETKDEMMAESMVVSKAASMVVMKAEKLVLSMAVWLVLKWVD